MDYYGLLFLYYLKGLSGKSVLRLFFNIEAGGTEQLLPENTSTPTTTPILADIQYPDGLRTDQYFTYRETPTTVSNKARIKTIKGNTLTWNQQLLAPTSNGGSTVSADGSFRANRCSFTYDSTTHIITITALENTGTSGFVFGLVNGAPLVVGHKYLQMCDVQAPKTFNFVIGVAGSMDIKSSLSANTYHHVSTIKEFVSSSNEFLFNFNSNNAWTGTETVYIKNAMLIDLTKLGLDITDPSEFTSLFSLPFYDYNEGTLLSFNGTGIKTTGKNLAYVSNGNNTVIAKVKSGITYVFSMKTTGKVGMNLKENSNSGTPLISTDNYTSPLVFTPNKDCDVFANGYSNESGKTFIELTGEFQIEFGSVATEYEPYTTSTANLPVSTYFPNGMDGINDVHDELTSSSYVKRISSHTFNSIRSFDSSGKLGLLGDLLDAEPVSADRINIKSIYPTMGLVDLRLNDVNGITQYSTGFFVRLQGKTTLQEYNDYLSANPLTILYELATPLENYGVVDLGTLTWQYSGTLNYFYTTISDMKSGTQNALCDKYSNSMASSISQVADKQFMIYENEFRIKDSAYTTTDAFKTAMSGVYLLYEKGSTEITPEEANNALSLLMGRSVSSDNAKQMIDIITKGE